MGGITGYESIADAVVVRKPRGDPEERRPPQISEFRRIWQQPVRDLLQLHERRPRTLGGYAMVDIALSCSASTTAIWRGNTAIAGRVDDRHRFRMNCPTRRRGQAAFAARDAPFIACM